MVDLGEIKNSAGSSSVNTFADNLIKALPPIYEKQNKETLLYKIYTALAKQLVQADIVLQSVQNNNFISISVENEVQIRQSGDEDRLFNENAFQLDQIRFSPEGSLISQNISLQVGSNVVQLYFIPKNIDFQIWKANDPNRVPIEFTTSFDYDLNQLTIIASQEGNYLLNYQDTGSVNRITNTLTIPIGLLRLGYNENGYSVGGWNE